MKLDSTYLHFDDGEAWDIVCKAAEQEVEKLRGNHPWKNRTGDMAKYIKLISTDDEVEIVFDVPYASHVENNYQFTDEFTAELESISTRLLELYLENV